MSRYVRAALTGFFVVIGAMTCAWLILHGLFFTHHEDQDALGTGPLLLSIQRIGQLHTVTFHLKDVLQQETQEDPAGWISAVPGADRVVHWATRNEAVVAAEGSVEAGLDLSRLTAKDVQRVPKPDGSTTLRVHLPPITIYPPVVHLHVINNQPGLVWRDEDILPKAQIKAEQLFLQSAQQGGIQAAAQENALQTLQGVERALGRKDIEFAF